MNPLATILGSADIDNEHSMLEKNKIKYMGEDEFNRKMGEYSQTPQAEQYLYDDLSGYDDGTTSQQSSYGDGVSTPSKGDRTKDAITDFIFGPLMGSAI